MSKGNIRKVILVSDGDKVARLVVEHVATRVGGRTISLSAGNPTPLKGAEIVHLIKQTPYDPVFVMFDDNGWEAEGTGERAMAVVANHPDIEVIGAIAVASNTKFVQGIQADLYINNKGEVVQYPVYKEGEEESFGTKMYGDTVDIINSLDIPVIVGIGDIGKMDKRDHIEAGSPITMKAVQLILEHNGYHLTPPNLE